MMRSGGARQGLDGVTPLDHRDAIKGHDPLAQTAGLALDFVTKVISAPMAMFLVADVAGSYHLAVIKADPFLADDPHTLARDYLASVATVDPVLEVAGNCNRAKLVGAECLKRDPAFATSALARDFLAANDLGPVAILFMRDHAFGQRCLLLLFRSAEEPEFSDREKGFMRQVAPFLIQSSHTAVGLAGTGERRVNEPITGNDCHLTPREAEIARLAAGGSHNDEIAASLHIASGTVKCHIRNIYAKLGVDSRVHLALALSD